MKKTEDKQEIDYTEGLPITPPEGMLDWLRSKGHMTSNAIIYKAAYVYEPLTEQKEKKAECHCTACGETFYADYIAAGSCSRALPRAPFGYYDYAHKEEVISGDTGLCPECGAQVKILHIGSIYEGYTLDECYPLTVQAVGGRLVLLSWRIWSHPTKEGKLVIGYSPYEGCVYDGKKAVRVNGYSQYMRAVTPLDHWSQKKQYYDGYGKTALVYPWDPAILAGTTCANSKLDLYIASDKATYPVTYLRLWQRRPQVENLIVQGAGYYINECIDATSGYNKSYYYRSNPSTNISGISWKEKRPAQMLGLNKTEFRRAVRHKWSFTDLEFFKERKAVGDLPDDDTMQFVHKHFYYIRSILELGASLPRTARYICKDKERKPDLLIDYWQMLKRLDQDPLDPDLTYPQHLKKAHDEAMAQINEKANERLRVLFDRRYKELSKYAYKSETTGLEIRPPMSHQELIDEGKKLRHCVGSYAEAHAEGGTAILFVRKSTAPGTPYFTLELNEKDLSVNQNRGKCNCARTPKVTTFESEWLEYIRNLEKTNKKEKKENGRNAKNGKNRKAGAA